MVENGSSGAPHVDEGTMHAWLDGALSADESRVVESHVASCETCAAAAAEARGLIAASTRILSALDDVPGDVIPASARSVAAAFNTQSSGSRRTRSTRSVRAYASIAAAAVVVVALTLVARDRSAPVARQLSAVTAESGEADTLAAPPATPPETSVAMASGAPKRVDHIEAQKPRVPSPAAPKSQVAVAPESRAESASVVTGVAAAVKSAPFTDSLTVTGRVTAAATGLPLADARVSVAGTGAVTATDSAGTFKVWAPPAGSHVLMAQKLGFVASSAIVNLPADSAARIALALPSRTTSLAEAVTTGVMQRTRGFAKSPPSIRGARLVSSDVYNAHGSPVRRSTFQLDSGATVTLEEWRPLQATPPVEDRSDTSARAATSDRTAPNILRAPSGSRPQSVTWLSSDSTLFILSGPLASKDLEELKKRVVP